MNLQIKARPFRSVPFGPTWVTLIVLAAGCATTEPQPPQQAQLTRAVSAPERKNPPEPLPGPVRDILRSRMGSHTRDMAELTSAIMILDYDRIRERATAIAEDANLARPVTGDATELAAQLPPKFFALQDEIKARARTLSLAAQDRSAARVAEGYGRLSETCVNCHAVYREGH